MNYGNWIYNTDDFTPAHRCSVCGYNRPMIAGENVCQEPMNYCQNCGAKMYFLGGIMHLIDKDDLIKKFYNPDEYNPNTMSFGRIVASLSDIKKFPEVDAVIVVRCKDCRYYDRGYCIVTRYCGDSSLVRTNPNDFCSYGMCKEKTNETD